MPKRWMLLILLLTVVVFVCGITWVLLEQDHAHSSLAKSNENTGKSQTDPALSPRNMASTTSPGTPPASVTADPANKTAGNGSSKAPLTADTVGRFQPVPVETNAQTERIAEAVKAHDGKHISILATATPFDLEAYRADPAGYTKTYAEDVQPARVYQTAAPGAGVPHLAPVTPTQLSMPQDGLVFLRVRTQAHAATSFTTLDGGSFGNRLAAQTVIADDHGIASVAYSAGPGTIDGVQIIAGSPLASGQVLFHVQVNASNASPSIAR